MNNTQKQTYVKAQITNAFFSLLDQYELNEIKINKIIETAQVSRNSFYRNYIDKEDIIRQFLSDFISEYRKALQHYDQNDNATSYKILFELIQKDSHTFLILRKRHLLHLLQEALLDFWGPVASMDNYTAYGVSFIMYGTYGWIDEWLHRGMQEDPAVIAQILAAGQKKTS